MGSRTIKPLQLGNALNDILAEFDKTSKAKANKGLRVAIVKTWGDIIEDTPIGITGTDGKTRGSWFIGRSVTKKLGRRNKTKGRTYVRNQTAKIDLLRTKIFLYNNFLDQTRFLPFSQNGSPFLSIAKSLTKYFVSLYFLFPSEILKLINSSSPIIR